jgi:glyoxylase I family protein
MIKAMNHVGVSVARLDRAIEFYCGLLGMKLVRQREFSGEQYETILALKGARGRLALLQAGSMRLELFEFFSPSPMTSDSLRPVCDHGITHFCIEVVDIDQEYNRLKAAGIRFHCPPMEFAGIVKATYGRDPDGNAFELVERYESAHNST